jgi:uncharacterized membrane protein YedE/YeeE
MDDQMNQDKEHLRLLAMFHYVVGSLAALFSFFPLLYSILGGFLLYAAHHPGPSSEEMPPAALGWIFIALGALFFLAGMAMAICILIAGRISRALQTLLFRARDGVYRVSLRSLWNTIVVLSRESVKTLFTAA